MSTQAPKFYIEGYGTIDCKTGKWVLNPDAPKWAKDELKKIKQLEREAKSKGIYL